MWREDGITPLLPFLASRAWWCTQEGVTDGVGHSSPRRELVALKAIVTTSGRTITFSSHKHPSRPVLQG